jgi:putative transposase
MTYHTPLPRPAHKPQPRLARVAITLQLADARSDLLVRHIRLLRDCVAVSQKRWDFVIEAAAVLPAEMQLLCAFHDVDFGVRSAISVITTAFDCHVPGPDASVWSNKCEVVEIAAAVVPLRRTFVEAAPVRAGLVEKASDWPLSSTHMGTVQSRFLGVGVA